jgi:hypothetical protein
MSSTINASTTSGGGIITSADASGVLALQTAGVTALTIDASQNVTLVNALGGTPTAPTAAVNTSTAQIATTAFANPASSLSANGYVKLPSGVIIQWGRTASIAAAGGTATITLPLAYTTTNYTVSLSPDTITTSANAGQYATARTTTTFLLSNQSPTTSTFGWQAIGY